MERYTVSLDDFIKYIIKNWKTLVACMVIAVVLFASSTIAIGKKIVIPPSEEYLELKEQEASLSVYIENAPIMEIDSTCVQEIVLYVSNISDREALKNHFDSGSVWTGFEYSHYLYYIMELITWADGSVAQSAEIIINHSEEKQCAFMAEFLSEKIHEFDENVEVLIGTQHIKNDEYFAEVQSWYKNRLEAIEGQLEYSRAGYTIEASLPVAIATGALVGGFVAIVMLFCGFLFNRKSQ